MGDTFLSIAGLIVAAIAAAAGPAVTFWIWRSSNRPERKPGTADHAERLHNTLPDQGVRWLSPETRYLTGDVVRHGLALAGNHAAMAVDGAVVLYWPSGQGLDVENIEFRVEAPEVRPSDLIDPEPAAVRSTVLADVVEENVRDYLLKLIPTQRIDDIYRVKVALRDIRFPLERYRRPLQLTIRPLSYWVVQHFNRQMVRILARGERDDTDAMLMSLREHALDGMLAPGQDLSISCPSPLYVEIAVVTSDDCLVCLTKDPEHSIYATTGRRWTCSIEEGVEWGDVVEGNLDFKDVACSGALKELAISDNEVSEVSLDALVLEYPNLSTAIVGTMVLSIPKSEIPPRVVHSPDFVDVRFVHVSEATRAIFGPKPAVRKKGTWWQEGSWHPTARLRALLCLYRYLEREEVLRKIILQNSRWRPMRRATERER